MRSYYVIVIIWISWWGYSSGHAQAPTAEMEALLNRSIVFTITQEFDSAEAICGQIQALDENSPMGYLLMAATLQSKMMDYETDRWDAEFHASIDRTIELAESRIKEDKRDAWARFYRGSALSYKSFYVGRQNHLLAAFKLAMKGIGEMKNALAIDSTLYDAGFAVGSYFYWKSRKLNFMSWLPFIKDDRAKGIRMIREAIANGKFSKYAAINGLAWIHLDAGRIDDAIATAKIGLERFPNSRFFLWCLADSYHKKGDFDNAQIAYRTILNSILTESFNNHYNEIVCRYKLASCFQNMEQYQASLNECDQALNLALEPAIARKSEKYIDKVMKIKKANERALKFALSE